MCERVNMKDHRFYKYVLHGAKGPSHGLFAPGMGLLPHLCFSKHFGRLRLLRRLYMASSHVDYGLTMPTSLQKRTLQLLLWLKKRILHKAYKDALPQTPQQTSKMHHVRKETGEPDKTLPEVDAQVRVPIEVAASQACMPTEVNDAGKVGPEEDAQVQV